jgi:hypothetical protein
MRRILSALALAMALSHAACGAKNATTKRTDSMKIRLKVEDRALTATLIDSKTTQDLVSLLPLTLTMNDLFRREKFGHLPRPISNEGKRTHTSDLGHVASWAPGPEVVISTATTARRFPIPALSSLVKSIPAWKLLMRPAL